MLVLCGPARHSAFSVHGIPRRGGFTPFSGILCGGLLLKERLLTLILAAIGLIVLLSRRNPSSSFCSCSRGRRLRSMP